MWPEFANDASPGHRFVANLSVVTIEKRQVWDRFLRMNHTECEGRALSQPGDRSSRTGEFGKQF